MASSEENWIGDIVHDFIHSSIWLSPIQTFIDTNCACFDYDEDDDDRTQQSSSSSLVHEQKQIYKQYQNLVNSLITSLSDDLKLDLKQLKHFCQNNNLIKIDDSYEQLYSLNDFNLFIEMMKRKNLILQLQALVNLQLECGLLKQNQTTDDCVLQLLMQATSTTTPAKKNSTDSKQKQQKDIRISNEQPKTIDSVPEDILRDKLRELSLANDDDDDDDNEEHASAMLKRKNFLQQQRDLIINKQRNERARELEKEIIHARPQSAAKVARKAMETNSTQQISNDELEKRRVMAAKLRREVVNKR